MKRFQLPNYSLQIKGLVEVDFLTANIDITTWGPVVFVVDRTAHQLLGENQ